MNWSVRFHPDVEQDLAQLGRAEAKRVLKVIRERIAEGEPDKIGKPLRGALAGRAVAFAIDGFRFDWHAGAIGQHDGRESDPEPRAILHLSAALDARDLAACC